MGGNATPPPVKWATLPEPTRARPVPFCRHCLAPVPATSLLVLAEAVPCRWLASSAVTTWCSRPMLILSCTRVLSQLVLADDGAVLVDSRR